MADDGVWDSWEDFADSGDIDRHVEQELNFTNGTQLHDQDKSKKLKTLYDPNGKPAMKVERNNPSPQSGIKILPRPIVVHEEDQNRTAYTPQLKILKRPEKSTEEQRLAEEERCRQQAKQPVRTLAQREAAYAEARQRIMGVEANHTNDVTVKQSAVDNRPENLKRYSKQSRGQNGSVDIKRQPKGPNNGKGFRNNR
ncbi:SUZ RNA-binding domain-containing-like isoform X2 [Clavelina lepadiformis]|uniref:SUZ RNA-binding domain-containing-like isoform X2 n=1 Tax=Clavelina lepadiformis TaxID=159417 RepID=UPI004041E46D